ncbi:MAG: translation initiation factor 2 [Pseudomonadota bacterium]
MKSKYAVGALLFASVQLSGCATIINGTSQDVDFNSDPAGAIIELQSGQNCVTPCTFSMRRGDDAEVHINKPGFAPVSVYIQSRLGGSTFGNIILGGGIGAVVDGSNGASNHLYPNPVYVRLVPVGSSEEPVLLDKDGVVIATVAAHNAEVGEDVREGIAGQGNAPRTDGGN